MKKILAIMFLEMVVFGPTYSQTNEFIIGGNDDDFGYSFAITEFGGYIIAGSQRVDNLNSDQISLSRIDRFGNIVWQKYYGDTYTEQLSSIERTNDNGYIATGTKRGKGTINKQLYLLKIDAEGKIEWERFIGHFGKENGFSVKQAKNGGYIACGYSNSNSTSDLGQAFIIKTDLNGNQVWEKHLGGSGKDFAFDIVENENGEIFTTGTYAGFHDYSTFEYTEDHSDILIAKIDENGNEIWTNIYGGNDNELAYGIYSAKEGGFYIIGSTQSEGQGSFDILLLKIDNNGVEEWKKTYGGEGFDYGRSISGNDEYLFLIGTSNNDINSNKTDLIVLKTDLNGNEIWTMTFGGVESEYGYKVRSTFDGGCAVVGTTKSFGNGRNQIYFLKLSAQGIIEPFTGSDDYELLVYPNPASNFIHFYFKGKIACDDFQYSIFNMSGQNIYTFEKTSKLVKSNISRLSKGVYNYRISSPCTGELKGKFIVH